MFNRGRQDISAEELGADLAALERISGDAAEAGHRVLSRFFFVYVAESKSVKPDSPHRHYEFLHATFGEYLVARLVVDEIVEIARAAFSSRRGVREPEDDLLFALLSFEALSARHPVLTFAREMSTGLPPEDRDHIGVVLATLLDGYRDRPARDRYQDYRPRPVDRVRESAAYTANLVLLMVAVDPRKRVELRDLFPAPVFEQAWRSMLFLWQSGLDAESYNSVLSILVNDQDRLRLTGPQKFGRVNAHLTALLAGDRLLATVVRHGNAFIDDGFDARPGDTWEEMTGPWLAHALARWSGPGAFRSVTMTIPDDAEQDAVEEFCRRLTMLLKLRAHDMDIEQAKAFIRIIADHEAVDPVALASAVVAHPGLLTRIPELTDPDAYWTPAAKLMLTAALIDGAAAPELKDLCLKIRRSGQLGKVTQQTLTAVRDLLEAFASPKTRQPLQPPQKPHPPTNHTSITGLTWDPTAAGDA